jgi:serine protease Do
VTRGWLGVTIQNVDRNLAESFGLDRPRGALVSQLAPGGPAEKAGVEPGDVIVEFAGQAIETSADLPHVVGLIAPDTRRWTCASCVTARKSASRSRSVAWMRMSPANANAGDRDGGGRLGVIVETAPEEMLARWDLSGGVLVREVDPDSPAGSAGLRAGDIITMVGSTPVRNAEAFADAVSGLEAGDSVPLRLMRRGAPLFIGLRLDD